MRLLQRSHVLAAYQEGSAARSTIADRAGCSRATVYRAEEFLAEQGLIENGTGDYQITGAGRALLHQIDQFCDGVAGTQQLRQLLAHIHTPLLVEHIHLLEGSEVLENTITSPYQIEHRLQSIIGDTKNHMIGMTQGLGSPTLTEVTVDRIEAGVSVEWGFPKQTVAYFQNQYDNVDSPIVAYDHVSIYVLDEIPLNLAIYDETLVVSGFDDKQGSVDIVAITDDPAAVDWGRRVIEKQLATVEQIA